MILKHFYEPSISQSSYLLGCAETGEALVVDPITDIRPYLEAAAAEGLRITAVAETHIHADFVSGARALADSTGATLYVSGEGGPDWQYGFRDEPRVRVLHGGDVITVGGIRLDVVHTPGHTPEHLVYVVTDTRVTTVPLGVFTGDFLFVGDVGRPDLLETAAGHAGTMDASARRLFASLRILAPLPDHLLIWPGHGSGSACGKSLSGVPVSSLGYERLTNWGLRETDESAFVASVLGGQPDPPMYFGEMKRVNKEGMPGWSPMSPLRAVSGPEIATIVATGDLIVDVRSDAATAFLPGSVLVPLGRNFSGWAGAVIPADSRFFIAARNAAEAEAARRALAIIGRTHAAGWISPESIGAYGPNGGRLEALDVQESPREGQTLVDVRTTAEWLAGHLEGAVHAPLARLAERVRALDRSAPLLVYCQGGTRSAIAATALRRLGFTSVASLDGGLSRYRARPGCGTAA